MGQLASAGAVLPTESGRQTGEQRPDRPNNSERPWSLPVCVSPPPPWARLFLLSAATAALAQSGDPKAGPRAADSDADAEEGRPAQARRVCRGRQAPGRPGRPPRMRLARPAGGPPDVAGRSRHRLPPPRSLRPLRLSGRPYPGDVPLPRAAGPHRSQAAGRRSPGGSTPAGSIRTSKRTPAAPTSAAAPSGTTNR